MEGDKIVCAPNNYHRKKDTYNYFKFTSHYDASSIYSQYLTKDFVEGITYEVAVKKVVTQKLTTF